MNNSYDFSLTDREGQTVRYTADVNGLFMYKDSDSVSDAVRKFLTDYLSGKPDFDECSGVYRIGIRGGELELYFADNSGMMRFYINQSDRQLYTSLIAAQKQAGKKTPNYPAIAQFLSYGCVYGCETVDESVFLSDPNLYYLRENGRLAEKPKNLKPLTEYRTEETVSLNELIGKAVKHCEGDIGCTITGGVDSRAVLANLISTGVKPKLSITGYPEHEDVIIARKIADILGLDITVVSDELEEADWLEHSVKAADGQEGICGIYRLDKLGRVLQGNGVGVQFGGVAGELYKNSFINQDFPLYAGKPNWQRFYKYKVGTFDIPRKFCGEKIGKELDALPERVIPWLETHQGKNKACAYLEAGFEIMQARANLVVNMFSNFTTSYNPLMERKLAAGSCNVSPYKLEMQAFQRREVSEYCPQIMDVKTDRNLTASYRKRYADSLKSYAFLIKVASQRVLSREKIDIRVDRCFEEGHKTEAFRSAIETSKRLGLLNREIKAEEIPTGLADRLFTIGNMFDD